MAPEVKRQAAPARVLVVDDDPDVVILLDKVLSKRGYKVVSSLSGEEAIEKALKEKPDIIFMDIMMPTMNGWEAARAIKENEKTKHIPIIFLSVRKEPEDIEKSLKYAHADAHIGKPINFNKLYEVIEKYAQAS
ncbi:MAG: response regulator [Euryarchaeota archaeon]|nr:response regulator [Euryarchaeota archaeon]